MMSILNGLNILIMLESRLSLISKMGVVFFLKKNHIRTFVLKRGFRLKKNCLHLPHHLFQAKRKT